VNDKAAEDCLSFNGTYVLLKNECSVKASPAGAKIVRKFSEKGNRLNDRASRFAKLTECGIVPRDARPRPEASALPRTLRPRSQDNARHLKGFNRDNTNN